MKRFHFPLGGIQKLRQARLEQETLRLRALQDQAARLKETMQCLEADQRAAGRGLFEQRTARMEELGAYQQFHEWGLREHAELASAGREAESQIRAQKNVVIEARRQVEMLVCLRERRFTAWRVEAERETEAIVADLVVARWKRGDAD